MGGKAEMVASDVETIEAACSFMGLMLNRAKFEVITHDKGNIGYAASRGFRYIDIGEALLISALFHLMQHNNKHCKHASAKWRKVWTN